MTDTTYQSRRHEIETYFGRTAAETWSKLTSDAPVGRIRATVRAGRDSMRDQLLSWLPKNLSGCRILDAGCGTGVLAVEAARRGADVVGLDLSEPLIRLATQRTPSDLGGGSVEFRVGDMIDPSLGRFDYTVAMDSLIHYDAPDMVWALAGLAERTRTAILFTFAPQTPALAAMHRVGRLFPRGNKAPSIQPVSERKLRHLMSTKDGLSNWLPARNGRISSGFYKSHGMELHVV